MTYLLERPRRLRRTEGVRALVRETRLAPSDFVLPLFAMPGEGVRNEIGSMPGVFQTSVDELIRDARRAYEVGVRSVILFGLPAHKDEVGTTGWDDEGPVQRAVRALKDTLPELVVMTDVCMCEYTSHGHCGALETRADGQPDVANDRTLELLAREALSHARAGADIVAPSDMMDGRVGAIRSLLDAEGFEGVSILSYAVKYASAFYGPFRDVADSAPTAGPSSRVTYQMDPANRREALREARLDVKEGADMLMVKPALSYLDIIRDVRNEFELPLAAYNVSGEYSMVKLGAKSGAIDGARVMMEILTSIRRAGADMILTYHAVEAAELLGG